MKDVTAAALKNAPQPMRKAALNLLAVMGWIGLPSTILSTFSGLKWVVDGAAWLYKNAGIAQPLLDGAGAAITFIVGIWRSITHPIWATLAEWLGFTLPAWGPDALTLLAICSAGLLRRGIHAAMGHHVSGALMLRGVERARAPHATYIRIPRRFPYAQQYADYGIRWTPRSLALAERLWREWRIGMIKMLLAGDSSHWPLVRDEVVEAQFGRFWLAITDGRRELSLYLLVAVAVATAFMADWAYRFLGPA